MSRAFMKERDDAPEPSMTLERTGSAAPITERGYRALQDAFTAATDPGERARIERILETVRVVAAPTDRSTVGFGATVTVRHAGQSARYTIVGEDEVDIPNARIGAASPLAQALLGTRVGDAVVWRRPVGDRALTVERIGYEPH